MSDIYEAEIKPLLSTLSGQSADDLMYGLGENFTELRKAKSKQHFLDSEDSAGREELRAETRRRAVLTATYAIGIVNRIDDII